MDFNLSGKKALICASSKGLGYAIAESLAKEGCDIFICGRNEHSLEDAKAKLTKFTSSLGYATVDLGTKDGVGHLIEQVRGHFGDIDILINNTGGPAPTAAKETSIEQWRQGYEQLFSPFHSLIEAFLPSMCEKGFGRIINITSMSVVEPIDNLAVSTAMRAAITANAKTLAREVASSGVTVNCVMPGVIHTGRIDFLRQKKAEREGTTLKDELAKTEASIPAKRMGRPEELANLVTFLASESAAYITGQNIAVDGGLTRSW